MCIIAALPIGTSITEEEFDNCWDGNPDGGGFAYVNELNQIVTVHNMERAEFKKAFVAAFKEYGASTPWLIHFRIGTDGEKTTRNCHPFTVNEHVVFAHNGVIGQTRPNKSADNPEKWRSDTNMFNELILKKLPEGFWKQDVFIWMLEDFIGGGSKIVFLDDERELAYLNKSKGEEEKDTGRWFSNSSYKWKRSRTTVYGGSSYQMRGDANSPFRKVREGWGGPDEAWAGAWETWSKTTNQPELRVLGGTGKPIIPILDTDVPLNVKLIKKAPKVVPTNTPTVLNGAVADRSGKTHCPTCKDWVLGHRFNRTVNCCMDCLRSLGLDNLVLTKHPQNAKIFIANSQGNDVVGYVLPSCFDKKSCNGFVVEAFKLPVVCLHFPRKGDEYDWDRLPEGYKHLDPRHRPDEQQEIPETDDEEDSQEEAIIDFEERKLLIAPGIVAGVGS